MVEPVKMVEVSLEKGADAQEQVVMGVRLSDLVVELGAPSPKRQGWLQYCELRAVRASETSRYYLHERSRVRICQYHLLPHRVHPHS